VLRIFIVRSGGACAASTDEAAKIPITVSETIPAIKRMRSSHGFAQHNGFTPSVEFRERRHNVIVGFRCRTANWAIRCKATEPADNSGRKNVLALAGVSSKGNWRWLSGNGL
jgi:hypothetical protein